MIKKIIKDSINILLSKPKLIRLAFLTTFGHTIYRSYLVAYFLNNIIRTKYEAGVEISEALLYLITKIQEFNIIGIIITVIAIVIIWNFLIYPIWGASIIYFIKDEGKSLAKAIWKGIKKFFVMFEFNGLGFAFGWYTLITIAIRLRIMGVLDNIILKILLVLWWIIVLFATIFWPYAKYYIICKNNGVFDAIKNSIYLALTNIGLTLKGILFEMVLLLRFIINAIVVIGVPLILIYVAVFFNIIDNQLVEIIIWITTGVVILLISYINGIFEAFFSNYRFKLFEKAEQNNIE